MKRSSFHDDRIIPIIIRCDAVVNIFGLPFDLTPAEAAKISAVIMAMAKKPSQQADGAILR